MRIRLNKMKKLTVAQLDELYAIEIACFQHPYTREQLRYEIEENEFSSVLGVYEEDTLIGFIDYWITFETCQLNQIAILPEYRRKGYGNQLMKEMIQHAEEAMCENIMLEVRVSNQTAQAMYEAFGFLPLQVRKGYYDNGEDAIVMVKPLGGNY